MFDGDPAIPRKKGTPTSTQCLAHVYCVQTAGWMKTPIGTEVDLSKGHIVLDGAQLPRKGHSSPPVSAHVYCGHGRPSRLLLSSCFCCDRLNIEMIKYTTYIVRFLLQICQVFLFAFTFTTDTLCCTGTIILIKTAGLVKLG